MKEFLIQSYYILLPIIGTALVGWVGVLLNEQRKKEDERDKNRLKQEEESIKERKANSTGIMLVLRYMLKRYHSEFMLQQQITYNQYKEWNDIYSAYKTLGGNSIAAQWNNDISKLKKVDYLLEISPYESLLRKSMSDINKSESYNKKQE